jgi:apolipoprotein N-acyltransferase
MSFIEKLKQYRTSIVSIIIAIVAGMFYALGFPLSNGSSVVIAPVIGFALLNWVLDKEVTLKKRFLLSLCYSLGFYQLGFYWIPHLLKEFGGLGSPFNYLLGMVFSVVIIPQVYFYVVLKRYIRHPLILALGYTLFEQFIPQQFPAHLGHPFISLAPDIRLIFAPIAGAMFYSFVTALTSLSVVSHLRTKKIPVLYYTFIALFLAAHLPFISKAPVNTASTPLLLRIVQPNIGNFLKVDSEKGGQNSIKTVFNDYYYLSTKNISMPLDLIVWPETAFPNLFYSDLMKNNHEFALPPLIAEIIDRTKAELFIGGYDSTTSKNEAGYQSDYNTAFHFSSEKYLLDVYHKRRLIPFGEGLPFGPLNSFLSEYITNISYFAEGDRFTNFKTRNNLNFTSVICYEVLFTDFVRDALNSQKSEAQFLINLTNDSWYGETAEPHQHLFLTKWRSVEFNLPVIRSTNTGITTVIFPDGSESARLGVGEKNYMDLELKIPNREKTIFQRFGMWSLLAIVFLLALVELAIKGKSFFQEIV